MVERLNLREQFSNFGYARVTSTEASRKLAWKLLQESQRGPKEIISGLVRQYTPQKLTMESTDPLKAELEKLVRETAKSVGVDDADEMFVVDNKLLVAIPKKGKQMVHWDMMRCREARTTYSFIIFLSSGCWSTALPKFPSNDNLSFSQDPATMRKVLHLLDEQQYESLPVDVGDIVFFRQSTPHFGVQNELPQGNRVAMFSILSSSQQWQQDADQVFSHLYVGYACSWTSREFAQALVDAKTVNSDPLNKIKEEQGLKTYQLAVRTLEHWGMTAAYSSRT
jgi:hypothetical protein